MTLLEKAATIQQLFEKFDKLAKLCKITDLRLLIAFRGDDTEEIYDSRLKFLESVNLNIYPRLVYVRSLLTEETWENYRLLGLHMTPEQLAFRGIRDEFREAWKAWKKENRRSAKNSDGGQS